MREAATGMGMTAGQRLRMVELPLALPVILAGVRIATVVSVGTATIAAAIGAGGLGTYVFRGLATVDTRLILAGRDPRGRAGARRRRACWARSRRARRPGARRRCSGSRRRPRWRSPWPCPVAGHARRPAGRRWWSGRRTSPSRWCWARSSRPLLEERGFAVQRRLNLGGTTLCHAAVCAGQLDVYVEYTGTALTEILKRPVQSDPARVLREVREGYRERRRRVGDPLGFNNTYALVVRRADAAARGLARISDLAPHAATLRVGLFGEFLEREDGMPGLLRAYGFRFGPPRARWTSACCTRRWRSGRWTWSSAAPPTA